MPATAMGIAREGPFLPGAATVELKRCSQLAFSWTRHTWKVFLVEALKDWRRRGLLKSIFYLLYSLRWWMNVCARVDQSGGQEWRSGKSGNFTIQYSAAKRRHVVTVKSANDADWATPVRYLFRSNRVSDEWGRNVLKRIYQTATDSFNSSNISQDDGIILHMALLRVRK